MDVIIYFITYWLGQFQTKRKLHRLIDAHCNLRGRYSQRAKGHYRRGEAPLLLSFVGALANSAGIEQPWGADQRLPILHQQLLPYAAQVAKAWNIPPARLYLYQKLNDYHPLLADRRDQLRLAVNSDYPTPWQYLVNKIKRRSFLGS